MSWSNSTKEFLNDSDKLRNNWEEVEAINLLKEWIVKCPLEQKIRLELLFCLRENWEKKLIKVVLDEHQKRFKKFPLGIEKYRRITKNLSIEGDASFKNFIESKSTTYFELLEFVHSKSKNGSPKNMIITRKEMEDKSIWYNNSKTNLWKDYIFTKQGEPIVLEVNSKNSPIEWSFFIWSLFVVPFSNVSLADIEKFMKKYGLKIGEKSNVTFSDSFSAHLLELISKNANLNSMFYKKYLDNSLAVINALSLTKEWLIEYKKERYEITKNDAIEAQWAEMLIEDAQGGLDIQLYIFDDESWVMWFNEFLKLNKLDQANAYIQWDLLELYNDDLVESVLGEDFSITNNESKTWESSLENTLKLKSVSSSSNGELKSSKSNAAEMKKNWDMEIQDEFNQDSEESINVTNNFYDDKLHAWSTNLSLQIGLMFIAWAVWYWYLFYHTSADNYLYYWPIIIRIAKIVELFINQDRVIDSRIVWNSKQKNILLRKIWNKKILLSVIWYFLFSLVLFICVHFWLGNFPWNDLVLGDHWLWWYIQNQLAVLLPVIDWWIVLWFFAFTLTSLFNLIYRYFKFK